MPGRQPGCGRGNGEGAQAERGPRPAAGVPRGAWPALEGPAREGKGEGARGGCPALLGACRGGGTPMAVGPGCEERAGPMLRMLDALRPPSACSEPPRKKTQARKNWRITGKRELASESVNTPPCTQLYGVQSGHCVAPRARAQDRASPRAAQGVAGPQVQRSRAGRVFAHGLLRRGPSGTGPAAQAPSALLLRLERLEVAGSARQQKDQSGSSVTLKNGCREPAVQH